VVKPSGLRCTMLFFLRTIHHRISKLTESAVLVPLFTLILYNAFAVIFFTNVEGWTWDQSIYFSMVTMSTVGYGDLSPTLWYSQLVGIFFILVGIVLVFGEIIQIVDVVFQPLFKKSRELVEYLLPAHYVDITGNGIADFKVPRRPLIFFGKGLIGPIIILLIFQAVSACIFVAVEPEWDMWTAIWYVMVTATTVGYGDKTVSTEKTGSLIWASVHILLSVSLLAAIVDDVGVLAEERRGLMKQLVCFEKCYNEETLRSLDRDGTGHLTKHEFILSMLVKIGKIDPDKDLRLLEMFYDRMESMDGNKDGKLNLSSEVFQLSAEMKKARKTITACVGKELQRMSGIPSMFQGLGNVMKSNKPATVACEPATENTQQPGLDGSEAA